ncbi:hypothetical protein ABPG72_021601 [Tetrahymena utriculariae]
MKKNNKFEQLKSSIKGSLNLKISQETMFSQRKEIIQQDSAYNIYYIMGNFHLYYQEFEILGEGCVGLVKKVRKISTGEYFACKTVKLKDEETVMQVIREFKNIKKLNHPNIVKMYELFVDEVKRRIYTIMELVEAREMFQVIRKLGSYSEQIASKIFKQILSSIKYMHEQMICHRDLKPNNILATEDGLCVKITDFNISKFGSQNKKDQLHNQNLKMWTYTGTVSFSAPEIFSESEYDQSVDIWSAGVVLYTMLSGQEPFQAEYLQDLIQKIQTADYSFPAESWEHISEDAKDLIRKCLILNAEERIKPEQALLHPWITGKQNTSPLALIFFNNFENTAKKLSKQVNAYEKLGLIKISERKKSVDSSILRQHQLRQFYLNEANNSPNSTKEALDDQQKSLTSFATYKNLYQQLIPEANESFLSFSQFNSNGNQSSPFINASNQNVLEMSKRVSICFATIKNLQKCSESIEESDQESAQNSPQVQRSPRTKKHHKTLIIHDRYRLSEQDQFTIQQNEIIASSTSCLSHTFTDEIVNQGISNTNIQTQSQNLINPIYSMLQNKISYLNKSNQQICHIQEQDSMNSFNSTEISSSSQTFNSKFNIDTSCQNTQIKNEQAGISPQKHKQHKNNTFLISSIQKTLCSS